MTWHVPVRVSAEALADWRTAVGVVAETVLVFAVAAEGAAKGGVAGAVEAVEEGEVALVMDSAAYSPEAAAVEGRRVALMIVCYLASSPAASVDVELLAVGMEEGM